MTDDQIRKARALRFERLSDRQIARALNVNASTIWRNLGPRRTRAERRLDELARKASAEGRDHIYLTKALTNG